MDPFQERVVEIMSFQRTSGLLYPMLLFVCAAFPPAAPAAGEPVDTVRFLPDVAVHSLSTSKDISLFRALAGRPAIVLLTDGKGGATCPLGLGAADLQQEYAPWFTWVAVLSGGATVADIELIAGSSPVRFERVYHDRAGAVGASLGLTRLPALLVVDEDGAVRQVCTPEGGAARLREVAVKLRSLAAGSRRRRAGFEDFRLPQVGAKELISFLDVAGRERTIVSFVNTGSIACARQLEVLDFVRVRQAGQVSFVTVFLDGAPDARIRGFLAAAGAAPDYTLRDPELRLAGRYGIDVVPTLLVIDGGGRIILSRGGYREEARDELYRDLERLFANEDLVAGTVLRTLREARRVHAEACAFLREGKPELALIYQERIREILPEFTSVHLRIAEAAIAAGHQDLAIRSLARYLASEPQGYDSSKVRREIAGLLMVGP
jgi:hypothetical protein